MEASGAHEACTRRLLPDMTPATKTGLTRGWLGRVATAQSRALWAVKETVVGRELVVGTPALCYVIECHSCTPPGN